MPSSGRQVNLSDTGTHMPKAIHNSNAPSPGLLQDHPKPGVAAACAIKLSPKHPALTTSFLAVMRSIDYWVRVGTIYLKRLRRLYVAGRMGQLHARSVGSRRMLYCIRERQHGACINSSMSYDRNREDPLIVYSTVCSLNSWSAAYLSRSPHRLDYPALGWHVRACIFSIFASKMSGTVHHSGPDLGAGVIENLFMARHLLSAVVALIFYEYTITFGREVSAMFGRKLSPAALLFLTIRWTLLFEAIALVLPQPSLDRCNMRTNLILIPALMGYGQTAIFSSLRVFAITDRNFFLSLVVLVLGLAPVATNSYVVAVHGVALPFIGPQPVICTPRVLIGNPLDLIIALCGRIPVVVSESLVVLLTWKKAYNRHDRLVNMRSSASITQTILRDGTAYFLLMILVNIAEILCITHGPSTAFAGPFLDALPPIIVCRFIMNLRRSSEHLGYTEEESEVELDSPGALQTMSLVFRHFHGGLDEFGRSLDVGEQSRSRRSSATSVPRSRGASFLSQSTIRGAYTEEGDIALAELAHPADSLASCSDYDMR